MELNLENQPVTTEQNISQEQPQQPQQDSNFAFLFANGGNDNSQNPADFTQEELSTFGKFLEKASKGKVKSPDQIGNLLNQAEEYDKVRPEFEKLQQEIKKPKFSNELSQRFDSLVAKGATNDELRLFFDAQSLDLGKMTDMELVKQQLLREQSRLTPEDIQLILEETYGSLEESELTGSKKLLLIKNAQNAKEFLQSLKAKTENPERLQQNNAAQQKQQEFVQAISTGLAKEIISRGAYRFDWGAEYGVSELSFKGKTPEENAKFEQQLMAAGSYVATVLQSNNLNPQSPEGQAAIKENLESVLFMMRGREIVKEVVQWAKQDAKKAEKLKQHNVNPILNPNTQKQKPADNPTQSKSQKDIEEYRLKKLKGLI